MLHVAKSMGNALTDSEDERNDTEEKLDQKHKFTAIMFEKSRDIHK